MAEVLNNLGSEHVWVVHGLDGIDEITTTGPTRVAELKDGAVRTFEVTPEDFGLPRSQPGDLKGGEAETNALAISALLDGHEGPFRDIALANASAALIVAGRADNPRAGVEMAAEAITDGNARRALERMIRISNEPVPEE